MRLTSLEAVLPIMASSLTAHSVLINTTASNMANANNVGKTSDKTYHSKQPVFEEIRQNISGLQRGDQAVGGVHVKAINHSEKELEWRFEPDNPLANDEGKVFLSDVNPIEEMSNMITASKQYQASVEIMKTTKNLLLRTINAING